MICNKILVFIHIYYYYYYTHQLGSLIQPFAHLSSLLYFPYLIVELLGLDMK